MAQTYSLESEIGFIESMLPFFRDRRYLKVNGAPLLIVYRPQKMPDARGTAERWRQYCRDAGIGEIHLVAALTHGNDDFEQFGYDAGVEFPPHNVSSAARGWLDNLGPTLGGERGIEGVAWDYSAVAQSCLRQNYTERRVYRGVVPSWDNTARMDTRAHLLVGATPTNYERWLEAASHLTAAERLPAERLVFINAWNEWAEGCHLEPDREHGKALLEATLRVKSGKSIIGLEWEPKIRKTQPQDTIATLNGSPSAAKPTSGMHASINMTTDGVAERAVRILARYPQVYRAARSIYRATLKS